MNKTNERLSGSLVRSVKVPLQTLMALSLGMIFLTSCQAPQKPKVDAAVWLNNSPLPAHICNQNPELLNYGFYRRLNNGQLEFINWCSSEANRWISVYETDFNTMLDGYVPPKRVQ